MYVPRSTSCGAPNCGRIGSQIQGVLISAPESADSQVLENFGEGSRDVKKPRRPKVDLGIGCSDRAGLFATEQCCGIIAVGFSGSDGVGAIAPIGRRPRGSCNPPPASDRCC